VREKRGLIFFVKNAVKTQIRVKTVEIAYFYEKQGEIVFACHTEKQRNDSRRKGGNDINNKFAYTNWRYQHYHHNSTATAEGTGIAMSAPRPTFAEYLVSRGMTLAEMTMEQKIEMSKHYDTLYPPVAPAGMLFCLIPSSSSDISISHLIHYLRELATIANFL
jgi:hypothetical protein